MVWSSPTSNNCSHNIFFQISGWRSNNLAIFIINVKVVLAKSPYPDIFNSSDILISLCLLKFSLIVIHVDLISNFKVQILPQF